MKTKRKSMCPVCGKIRKVIPPFGLRAQGKSANARVLQPASMIATGGYIIDVSTFTMKNLMPRRNLHKENFCQKNMPDVKKLDEMQDLNGQGSVERIKMVEELVS